MTLRASAYNIEAAPESFPELNQMLMDYTKALDEARRNHLQFSNDLKNIITEYKVKEAEMYGRSYGLDLTKPIAEQRQQGKRSPGTAQEHEAYVIYNMREEYKQVAGLEYLIKFWEKQMDAAKTQISALQSIGANMRSDPSLQGRPEPRF